MARLFTMLGHLSGQLLNLQSLSRSLGIHVQTLNRYLDFLEETFVIRRLAPYHVNLGKRLVKSPKVYLRDSGVLHQLLGIETFEQLLSNPIRGASFESYAVEQVYAAKPRSVSPSFYRTHAGAEIDLVLLRAGRPYAAIEIKQNVAPKVSRGFYQAVQDLSLSRAYLLCATTGDSYTTAQGVEVIGLQHLAQVFT